MEGPHMKSWILILVVVYGLSMNTNGQKTFRRACDCEYMVDGKCAYTLLLPTGQGESMCPQGGGDRDSDNGEMNMDMQQRVDTLHRNFTELLGMYSSQASMLNQVYSTLMDKLLSCPLLQSCAMSTDVPDFGGARNPDGNGNGQMMPTCADVCPEVNIQIEELGRMATELQNNLVDSGKFMNSIETNVINLNMTVTRLSSAMEAGGGGSGGDQGNGPDMSLSSIGTWVRDIVNKGLLCSKKGPLVSGDDSFLSDAHINASSIYDEQHVASRVRINARQEDGFSGAWCPDNSSRANAQGEPNVPGKEWIQFDLGRVRTVYGIVTKGRSDYEQWVETYMVYYSTEPNPLDTHWIPVKDLLDVDTMIFNGNKNQYSPKYNFFDNHIQARYVRIIPLSGYEGQNMCMRADVIGCVEEPTLP